MEAIFRKQEDKEVKEGRQVMRGESALLVWQKMERTGEKLHTASPPSSSLLG